MTTKTPTDLTVIRADSRGRTRLGWLDSAHSFSFGRYHDPARMGFRSLRVINDDVIAPGGGFGEHPHADMEILTWVLDGALRHGDSLANSELLVPGELQRMSAGTGIRHSEFNASETEPARLLQVWIEPDRAGHAPRYDQRAFPAEGRVGCWQALAAGGSRAGGGDALRIHQDASLSVADLGPDDALGLTVEPDRFGYVHVAAGSVRIDGGLYHAGDAVSFAGPGTLDLVGQDKAQVLVFDLA
jgi:hypothetical protein